MADPSTTDTTTPAAPVVPDLSAKVSELQKLLNEMTADRNAFRAKLQKIESQLAKDVVVIGGKIREIVQVCDGDTAMHKLHQNVDFAKLATWLHLK